MLKKIIVVILLICFLSFPAASRMVSKDTMFEIKHLSLNEHIIKTYYSNNYSVVWGAINFKNEDGKIMMFSNNWTLKEL